jgi:hypothetical protein
VIHEDASMRFSIIRTSEKGFTIIFLEGVFLSASLEAASQTSGLLLHLIIIARARITWVRRMDPMSPVRIAWTLLLPSFPNSKALDSLPRTGTSHG